MFENYVILEEVDWEWIILKKKLFEIYIQIVENYTILGENRVILDQISRELHDSRREKAQFSLTQLYPSCRSTDLKCSRNAAQQKYCSTMWYQWLYV